MAKEIEAFYAKLIKKAWVGLASKSKKICAICDGDLKVLKSQVKQDDDVSRIAIVYTDLVNEKMGKSRKIRLCGKCLSRLNL